MARSVSSNKVKAAFLAGNMTCMFVVLIAALFVGYRVGFGTLVSKFRTIALGHRESPVDCPQEVLKELKSLGAVIENAGNPTDAKEHDSVIVQPDPEFVYRLRGDAQVAGHVLKATKGFNLDPPVLYMDANLDPSDSVQRWIDGQTRGRILYTTTADGLRTTTPKVEASRQCLFVGDSVCFGVGVDDADTMVSVLQRQVGSDVAIINAGVGGYEGRQVYQRADKLSAAGKFERLVYVACDNDFSEESPRVVMQRFSDIKDRFEKGICVVYTPYLEYIQGELIFGGGGSENWNQKGDQRISGCRSACDELGLDFIDVADHIRSHRSQQNSIFAGLEWFVDHCHFSIKGNRVIAKLLAGHLYPEEVAEVATR